MALFERAAFCFVNIVDAFNATQAVVLILLLLLLKLSQMLLRIFVVVVVVVSLMCCVLLLYIGPVRFGQGSNVLTCLRSRDGLCAETRQTCEGKNGSLRTGRR